MTGRAASEVVVPELLDAALPEAHIAGDIKEGRLDPVLLHSPPDLSVSRPYQQGAKVRVGRRGPAERKEGRGRRVRRRGRGGERRRG